MSFANQKTTAFFIILMLCSLLSVSGYSSGHEPIPIQPDEMIERTLSEEAKLNVSFDPTTIIREHRFSKLPTWESDVLIASGTTAGGMSATYDASGNMYAARCTTFNGIERNKLIVYKSTDEGQNWQIFRHFYNPDGYQYSYPQLLVCEAGTDNYLYVFHLRSDSNGTIRLGRYTLDGSYPMWYTVVSGGSDDTITYYSACTDLDGDTLIVLYERHEPADPTPVLRFIRSTDCGANWFDDSTIDSHGAHPDIAYGKSRDEDTLKYDDGSPLYDFRIPDRYGDDLFNVRFTPAWDYLLKSVQFLFYYKIGYGAVRIYVWDDTCGFPAQKIDSVDVSHVNVQLYPYWTTVDFSSKKITLSSLSDFHVGYTPLGPPETDTVAIRSDDGDPPGTEHRSIEFYNGAWSTMYDDWGVDVNFMIRAVVERITDVEEEFPVTHPTVYELFQNYPNPFNPQTKVSYYLPRSTWVNLAIYNLLGQRVKTLVDEYQNAGAKAVFWDGEDSHQKEVASGMYFYRLKVDSFTQTKKMVLIR